MSFLVLISRSFIPICIWNNSTSDCYLVVFFLFFLEIFSNVLLFKVVEIIVVLSSLFERDSLWFFSELSFIFSYAFFILIGGRLYLVWDFWEFLYACSWSMFYFVLLNLLYEAAWKVCGTGINFSPFVLNLTSFIKRFCFLRDPSTVLLRFESSCNATFSYN